MWGFIKACGTMFLIWLLMEAVGIMNDATMVISLVVFVLYRVGFFGFMVDWTLNMMEWWGDEGAELWDEAMKDRKKAKKKKAKKKAKAAAEKMGPPKGYISIAEHNEICRALKDQCSDVWHNRFNEGVEFGKSLQMEPSSVKEDAIFAYLFNPEHFENHVKSFMESPQNYDWWEYLGLGMNATTQEINAAFRKGAAKYHPDRNPGDDVALHAFQKINEAREIGIEKRKTRASA